MHVLVVKTSSLGDVIHCLPAISDAAGKIRGIEFDWVVEEAFADIPTWHPAINQVIPVAIRRWRTDLKGSLRSGELAAFKRDLREKTYDLVIDAQGLVKSAVISRIARGLRYGLDRKSIREPLAALAYQRKIHVPKKQHAIKRVRQLFATALGYAYEESCPDYGITSYFPRPGPSGEEFLVFLHGTTWVTKHWPEVYWHELAALASRSGIRVKLPWATEAEKARAERIAAAGDGIEILPKLTLAGLATTLRGATGVVGVDTGLVHLAAAFKVPSLTIYGATDPSLTGTMGHGQHHIQADFACSSCLKRQCAYQGPKAIAPACYTDITPALVWKRMEEMTVRGKMAARSTTP